MNVLRPDFKAALEGKVDGFLGPKGTDRRATLEKAFSEILDDSTGKVDLARLPEKSQRELRRLQTASEGFESHFVKDLLGKMRATTFSEEKSPMGDFAKDMMDQAFADGAAKSGRGLGIAKTVFLSMGEQVVKQGLSNAGSKTGQNP
ncbi:MAG: rod-binding protein [Fimbriimonadaceae bacterium]|nr:rod-binding protein [Fimbriimonadaceae bacterium]